MAWSKDKPCPPEVRAKIAETRKRQFADAESGPVLREKAAAARRGRTPHNVGVFRGTNQYHTTHLHLKNERGRAAQYACDHCGQSAAEWAYIAEGAAERLLTPTGMEYSMNLQDYAPLCVSCHRRYDKERAR